MKLSEKTTERLENELNGLKIVNGALIGVLITLFVVCIYGLLKKDDNGVFTALIVVPIALSAIIPLNFENMKKIKLELEARN